MFFLNVPYAEKDEARQLGARWDAGSKKWYVPKGVLATPFARWMPASAEADRLLGSAAAKLGRKVAAKSSDRPVRRPNSARGKVTIGENYRPVEGATGLPWDV